MGKKRKIDYILFENNDYKIVFRFYPRQSSCHSFGDEPPKSWENVYKVYYHYRILKFWKDDDGNLDGDCCVLFDSKCDECSVLDEIGHICLLLTDGVEVFKRNDGREFELLNQRILPFGMGIEWTVTKETYDDWEDEDIKHIYYIFTLFDYWDVGFRFTLEDKKIKAFGEYLLECCEYMLAHGDPI